MSRKQAINPDELAKLSENGQSRSGTYTFSQGRCVSLNKLGEAVLTGLLSDVGKPTAPQREIEMAGGAKMKIARSDDEPFLSEAEVAAIENPKDRDQAQAYRDYRLALQQFNMRKGLLFARTIFLLGVQDGPTSDESAIWQAIGFTDPYDIKYMWLAMLCAEMEDWNNFIEAVLSYSMPTEEGIEEMQELFRGSVAGQPPATLGVDGHMGGETTSQASTQKQEARTAGNSR